MNIIYILLVGIIIFQIARRRFDFLSIAAISFVFYTSNCITGKVWIEGGRAGVYYTSNIKVETYILILCQMILIILSMYRTIHGKRIIWPTKVNFLTGSGNGFAAFMKSDHCFTFWRILMVFNVSVFIYTIFFQIGLATFFSYTRKGDLYNQTGVLYSLAVWGSVLCFMYGMHKHKRLYMIAAILLILMTFISGSRAYLATALVDVIVIKAKRVRNIIKSNTRVIIFGIFAFLFLLVYKNIYSEVRALDFEAVLRILSSPKTYSNMLDIAEFRIILSIYNYVIENSFHLPFTDSIVRVVSIVPFVNDYIGTSYPLRFSAIAQYDFFGASYGLANSFWGETYAMGGFVFLMLITELWLYFMKWCNKFISGNGRLSPFIMVMACYFSFYLHRLDWLQVLGCMKSVLVFYLIWYVINYALVRNVHVSSNFKVQKESDAV